MSQSRASRPLVWGATLAAVAIFIAIGAGAYLWKDQSAASKTSWNDLPVERETTTPPAAQLPAVSDSQETPNKQPESLSGASAPDTKMPESPLKLQPGRPLGVDVVLLGARIEHPRVYAQAVRYDTLSDVTWKYEIRPKRGQLVLELSEPIDTGVGGFIQSGTAAGPFVHAAANPARLLWVDQAYELVDRSLHVVHSHPDPVGIGAARPALGSQAGGETESGASDLRTGVKASEDGTHATIDDMHWYAADRLPGQFDEIREIYLERPARELHLTYVVVRVVLKVRRVENKDFRLRLPDGRLLNPFAASGGMGFSPSWLATDLGPGSGKLSLDVAFIAPELALASGDTTFHFRSDRPLHLSPLNRQEPPTGAGLAGDSDLGMPSEIAGGPLGTAMTEEQLRNAITGPPATVTYWERDKKIELQSTAIGYRLQPLADNTLDEEMLGFLAPEAAKEPSSAFKALTKLRVAAKVEPSDDKHGIDGGFDGDFAYARPEATEPVSEMALAEVLRLEWKYTTAPPDAERVAIEEGTPELVAHVTVTTKSSIERLVDVLPVYPPEVLEDLAFSELHSGGYEAFPGMGGPIEPGIAAAHVSLLGITTRRGEEEIVEIPLNFASIALVPPANAPFDPTTIDWENLRSNIKRRQLERWTTAMIKQYKEELIRDIKFGPVGD